MESQKLNLQTVRATQLWGQPGEGPRHSFYTACFPFPLCCVGDAKAWNRGSCSVNFYKHRLQVVSLLENALIPKAVAPSSKSLQNGFAEWDPALALEPTEPFK